MRRRTIEWQVCGVCNYDCSYCIQSRKSRVGHPTEAEIESFLTFFSSLPGSWEIKMTGGEPFAFKGFMASIVPGLIARTPHRVSALTNLSAPVSVLERFAELTRGRLEIVSASLHLEFTSATEFIEKATRLRAAIGPEARMVVNSVAVPGRLEQVRAAERLILDAGLPFFPQLMKTKHGVHDYDQGDTSTLVRWIGRKPSPRTANVAPSYRGRMCHAGAEYFVLLQTGEAFRCRTARRFGEGRLGSVHDGSLALALGPTPCTYDICPCTVPANRGMIQGIEAS